MVLPGEEDYMAATRHERSKILHNFTFPELKWGSQRNLRRIKVDSDDGGSAAGYQRSRRRSSPFKDASPFRFDGGSDQRSNSRIRRLETEPSENEGIKVFREKIMSDLRTVADKMRESMFRKQASGDEEHINGKEKQKEEKSREREVSPPEAPEEAVEARPWNLRKRRAACKAPISGYDYQYSHKGLGIEEDRAIMDPPIRSKFFSTLSKKEIEEDYMKMMGHRPPRRPKKRPRAVQKQVDISTRFQRQPRT